MHCFFYNLQDTTFNYEIGLRESAQVPRKSAIRTFLTQTNADLTRNYAEINHFVI